MMELAKEWNWYAVIKQTNVWMAHSIPSMERHDPFRDFINSILSYQTDMKECDSFHFMIWKLISFLAANEACHFILMQTYYHKLVFNSRTCLELGEICREVGLPPGILNILTGLGPEAGAPLASHPDVDKV